MNLASLRNSEIGETVYVLGSGSSLGFIDPGFFADKTVVTTNFAARILGIRADFGFSHYHGNSRELSSEVDVMVTLERDTLSQAPWGGEKPYNVIFAPQNDYTPPGAIWNPLTTHKPREDSLVYGSSSLHGAIHLAAHIGASYTVLVGADCGRIDGENRIEGYPPGHTPWKLYEAHHRLIKRFVEENYPTKVYSLNPFINFNLEGHTFEGPE